MEDPRPKLQDALKAAMRAKDTVRRDVIRLAQSAIKQEEIDSRKDLKPEDVVTVLQKEAKMRRESIDELRQIGREDDAAQGEVELAILEEFLPQQMSRDEIEAVAQQVIDETSATNVKDMGKVMGPVMGRVKGRADGGLVSQVVRELLSRQQ
jgi:uncharacterized protein YqeY